MKIWISIFVVIISSTSLLFAQKSGDVDLLLNTDFGKPTSQRQVKYGFSENPSKIWLYNPVYHVLSGSMWVYQKYVSPQLASECGFNPSCSAYSKQLIEDFGIVKGVVFSADRLMRCNRIALTGLPRSVFETPDRKIHESTDRYSLK
jgi:putative component of membrane protein insertase Oxa1/YidC/SpoIIIJ protein YidD